MSNLYLSFLGTSDYVPCTYNREGQSHEVENVRFVQEATISMCCRDWTSEDRIRVFTTAEARKKNWLDGYFFDKQSNEPLNGLKTCINRLELKADVADVPIPEGKNEEEIWGIFKKVYDEIREGESIIFDITHALRSIPLLACVIMNYAKVLKRVSVRGIFYGAFETLGRPDEARKMEPGKRRVPVFDLSPLDALQDWALAIDRFLGSGDAGPVCELATGSVRPILRESQGQNRAAAGIRSIALGLKELSQAIATCRGTRISEIAQSLKNRIGVSENLDLLPALHPLMDRVRERISRFRGDSVLDGIQAARWCLEHNLIQQGYTILNETLITHCLICMGLNPEDTKNRDGILYAAKICGDESDSSKENPLKTTFFRSHPELARIMIDLADRRNDLNHAGYRENQMPADRFAAKLRHFLAKVEDVLAEPLGASGG